MNGIINLATKLFCVLLFVGIIEGCGNRLGRGAIICGMGYSKMRDFKTSLCTHTTVDAWLECNDEVCNPRITIDSEDTIKELNSRLPIGLYLGQNVGQSNYFRRSSRRMKTVKSIADFMSSKNMTFVQFGLIKGSERRNQLDLIEEMAAEAHRRGWPLGLHIEVIGLSWNTDHDFADLATFVDWFVVSVRRQEWKKNEEFFLGAAFPLKSKGSEGGSYKYALDYLQPLVESKCLLVQIEGGGKKYVAIDETVDPGPGSLATFDDNFWQYKDICRRNIDDHCPQFWDEEASMPYSVCKEREYFSFENATSIGLKIDLMKSYGVAGVFFYTMVSDDDEGICGFGRMPQLRAMQDESDLTRLKWIVTRTLIIKGEKFNADC